MSMVWDSILKSISVLFPSYGRRDNDILAGGSLEGAPPSLDHGMKDRTAQPPSSPLDRIFGESRRRESSL